MHILRPFWKCSWVLWNAVDSKVVRSRDVVFFEEKTIKDIKKPKKQKFSLTPVTFDPFWQQMTHRVEGGYIQHDDDNLGYDGHDVPTKFEPLAVELQPQHVDTRRSTRGRHPFKRYPITKFVLLSDGGEPKDFQEVTSHEK